MSNDLDGLISGLLSSGYSATSYSATRPLPPVEQWDPPLSGDINIEIKKGGQWFHDGVPIQRDQLTRLFASILKREGDDYFLVTPVEKWRIRVEDVPFVVVSVVSREQSGVTQLIFESNVGDRVVASADNPLWVTEAADSGEPSPYLLVRPGLPGRLTRSVFYELVDLAVERRIDGKQHYGVESLDQFFPLSGSSVDE